VPFYKLTMRRLISITSAALVCGALSGCSPRIDDATVRRFLPEDTDRFAREYVDSLRKGALAYVVSMLAPPLDTP